MQSLKFEACASECPAFYHSEKGWPGYSAKYTLEYPRFTFNGKNPVNSKPVLHVDTWLPPSNKENQRTNQLYKLTRQTSKQINSKSTNAEKTRDRKTQHSSTATLHATCWNNCDSKNKSKQERQNRIQQSKQQKTQQAEVWTPPRKSHCLSDGGRGMGGSRFRDGRIRGPSSRKALFWCAATARIEP